MQAQVIKTERLILRPWMESDLEPFALMNADPRVREYFFTLLTNEESNSSAADFQKGIEERGWGLWAAALIDDPTEFMGFIGIAPTNFVAHFTPAVEIGWRLAYKFWGKGYATEGASAALKYGFETIGLDEIVACTTSENRRSQNVMKKLKTHYNPEDDFDHPRVPPGHKLTKHILYRIDRREWLSK